jgi:CheY-like chemotaxis protein
MQVLDSVLLVDDDVAANFFHRNLIHNLGLAREVIQTTNGREAFDFIENNYRTNRSLPSLVLLDIAMPKMDGIELIKHLKESNLLGVKKIPLAIVSISEKEKYEQELNSIGEISYVTKPLSKLKFLDMLQKTIVPSLNSSDKINYINSLHQELDTHMQFLKHQNAFLQEQRNKIREHRNEIRDRFNKYKDNK